MTLSSLNSLLQRSKKVPLLTAEEEIRLNRLIRHYLDSENPSKRAYYHYQRSRQTFFERNIRLPIKFVLKFRHKCTPAMTEEDLFSEAFIGMSRAIDLFDGTRGYKFSTFCANWIKQAIGRAIENNSSTIRVPVNTLQTARRYLHERGKDRCLTVEQYLKTSKSTNTKRPETLKAGLGVLFVHSLNAQLDGPDGERELGSLVVSTSTNSLEDIAREDQYRTMYEAIDNLEEHHKLAFKMKYLENASNSEIGQQLGIERRNVSDVLSEAKSQLRAVLI